MGFRLPKGNRLLRDLFENTDLKINSDYYVFKNGNRLLEHSKNSSHLDRLEVFDSNIKKQVFDLVSRLRASLKVEQVQRFDKKLLVLSNVLSKELGVAITMNLYFTPAFSQCFEMHSDQHNIFVIQLYGKKDWFVGQVGESTKEAELRSKVRRNRFTLSGGKMLYLPIGAPHIAETKDKPSVHLSVGFHPYTVASFMVNLWKAQSKKTEKLVLDTSNLQVKANYSINTGKVISNNDIKILEKEFRRVLFQLKKKGWSDN